MNTGFEVVDGLALPDELRALLRPDEDALLPNGSSARLPRFFYKIETWQDALSTKLTPHFTLAELMLVDCREATPLLREFPHYVPCTISVLARYLEVFRERVEAPVYIAVNGGYHSPAHALSQQPSLHPWGTAANIYRVGDTWVDDERASERYSQIARGIGQEIAVAEFGTGAHQADDHLHLDLGLLHWAPA